jgi:hypothetical protein
MRKALTDFAQALHTELFLARDGPSFSQVRRKISDGRHAILPALNTISALSASIDHSQETLRHITIRTEHGNQAIPVANWTLAFVAKEIVYVGREEFDQPISDGLLAFYSTWYTSIIDPRSILDLFSRSKRRQRARSILIRMDYEQVALQRLSPVAELARALILYEPLPGIPGKSSCDPLADFTLLTGLTIMDFMVVGFACYYMAQPPHSPVFASFFGQAFQRYVGELLREILPPGALFPERTYGPRDRARDSCDWLVLDNDAAIPIECKTSRFHKTAKSTGDPGKFLKEATETYAKAIAQILRTRQAIQNGQIPLPASPSVYLGLVVIFDHLLMATVHLREDLRALVARMDSSFTPQDVETLDYRILPIRLLELFTPTIAAEGLARIFDPASWEANRQREQGGHSLPNLLKRKFADFESRSREAFQV